MSEESFAPTRICFTSAVPKKRSAKVVRRATRAATAGAGLGDLSSIEDQTALDAVRSAS